MKRIRPDRLVLALSAVVAAALVGAVLVATADRPPDRPDWLAGSLPTAPPSTAALAPPASPVDEAADGAVTTSAPERTTVATAAVAATAPPLTPADEGARSTEARTSDGVWKRITPLGPEPGELVDVVAVGGVPGLVLAAGRYGTGPVVLASTDSGEHWERLRSDGLPDGTAVRSIAADAERVVAVVADAQDSAVWELRGDAWRQVALPRGDGETVVLSSVALAGGVLVAAGYDSTGSGLWAGGASPGGLAAVSVATPAAAPGTRLVYDVTATRSGFVAVGRSGDAAVRWTSADGTAWHALVLPVDRTGAATASAADGALVAGYDGSGAVLWRIEADRAVAERLPAPVDRPQSPVFVSGTSRLAVVGLREGRSRRCWERADGEASFRACRPGPVDDPLLSMRALTTVGDRFVGAGAIAGAPAAFAGLWVADAEP